MEKQNIKKLIAINVPISGCNLRCHYCYISQLSEWEKNRNSIRLDPVLIQKALSIKRLGGPCIINITGKGETLIPKEMPEIIRLLLEQGHYLEIVTNGTLTDRFEEIAKLSEKLLHRLEFKFSFHYLELKKRGLIDRFFENIIKMRDAGCSFTVELMPNDELIPHIDDIKKTCLERVGALCHLTIGRDDTNGRKILTNLSTAEYINTWESFDSEMFTFKYSVFNKKRNEFCYAGMWTLYIDLVSGDARQCYGFKANQNIYNHLERPLYFRPVGHCCKQPFCFNAHAFMTLGVIPEITTPTYAEIRDRVDNDGRHWLTEETESAFSSKLFYSNEKINGVKLLHYYLNYPVYWMRVLITNKNKIIHKIYNMVHRV